MTAHSGAKGPCSKGTDYGKYASFFRRVRLRVPFV
jgi:hypothetical protein